LPGAFVAEFQFVEYAAILRVEKDEGRAAGREPAQQLKGVPALGV